MRDRAVTSSRLSVQPKWILPQRATTARSLALERRSKSRESGRWFREQSRRQCSLAESWTCGAV